MSDCDAKIRPFHGATELQCERTDVIPHDDHRSVLRDYAYAGSATTIRWLEDDRRTFRGEWAPCNGTPGCTLPAEHRGKHAV